MANPLTDDFTLPLAGNTYHFRFGLREVIDMQEQLVDANGDAPSVQAIDQGIRAGRLRYVRAIIWAGLQKYHPRVTEDQVTDLMATANEAEMRGVLEAFGYSVRPDQADLRTLGLEAPPANPPEAQAQTTGEPSTGMHVGVV